MQKQQKANNYTSKTNKKIVQNIKAYVSSKTSSHLFALQ